MPKESVSNQEITSNGVTYCAWSMNYARNLTLKIAENIREYHEQKNTPLPDLVIGIKRGGYYPAVWMSEELEIEDLRFLTTKSYTGVEERGRISIAETLDYSVKESRILLVDDVADHGDTMRFVHSYLKMKGAEEVMPATLAYKPWSSYQPLFMARETEAWIIFPWEWEVKETVQELACKKEYDLIGEIFTPEEIENALNPGWRD